SSSARLARKGSSGRSAPTAGSSTPASAAVRSGRNPSHHAAAATLATRARPPKAASAPRDPLRPGCVLSSAIHRPAGVGSNRCATRRGPPRRGLRGGAVKTLPHGGPRGGIRDCRPRAATTHYLMMLTRSPSSVLLAVMTRVFAWKVRLTTLSSFGPHRGRGEGQGERLAPGPEVTRGPGGGRED